MAFPDAVLRRQTAPIRAEYDSLEEWGVAVQQWIKSRGRPIEGQDSLVIYKERIVEVPVEKIVPAEVEVPVEVEKVVRVYVQTRAEADEIETAPEPPIPNSIPETTGEAQISDAFRRMMEEGETVEEAGARMWKRLERLNALVADHDADAAELREQTALHQIQYELSRFQDAGG